MKQNGIFIDLRNEKQVEWWNHTAHKLVKVVKYETLVETATGKPVGYLVILKGLFKNYVIKKNKKFIKNAVTAVFNIES